MSALRDWLTGTFAGRALLLGLLIKGVMLTVAAAGASIDGMLGLLDTIGGAGLVLGLLIGAYRLWVPLRRRLLWRVRRKLTLSYVFIGFVPALLIIVFFLIAGLLLFFNIGSYLMRSRIDMLVDQARVMAEATAVDLERARSEAEFRQALERAQTSASGQHPNASFAVVPADMTCERQSSSAQSHSVPLAVTAGRWAHLDAPTVVPSWVPCDGRAGLLAYREGAEGRTQLAVRAIAFPNSRRARYAVTVDVPVSETFMRQFRADTGVQAGAMTAIDEPSGVPPPVIGRAVPDDSGGMAPREERVRIFAGPAQVVIGDESRRTELEWVTLLDYVDWDSGSTGTLVLNFQMSPVETYRRLSATSLGPISLDVGQILLIVLAVVGGLFLVIQLVAFGMGLALARSITGSVHALFVGTARVRQGDFTHRIAIRTRDQLGELAESFNTMTSSIEELLEQKAEKERLEQELRVARAIQTSLLPQGPIRVPGFAVTAHCEPAREVGGDYYDVLPIDEHRIGVLVADVSGKGPSAALYMAELKGLMLSLVELYRSPRALLIGANGILLRHLDPRSYITMIYAVLDLEARTLTYARAGHCPMLRRSAPRDTHGRIQTLSAQGLVLGLQLDNGEMFAKLLEEESVPLVPGDLLVLYTDGITEATNTAGEWFGEERLAALVDEHGDRPPDELRERILREIQSFVGKAPQHDDMTMVLLKMEGEWSRSSF